MTEQAPEEPQRPKAECPLQTCNWWIYFPASGDLMELEPQLAEHTESHTPQEFMNTIGILQEALFESHQRIAHLESALRGAAIVQMRGQAPQSAAEAATGSSGLLLPPGVGEDLTVVRESGYDKTINTPDGHKGRLVGKKITDPMVLKDLKKGEGERGK